MGAENFGYSRQLFKTGGQFESFKELGEPSQEHCFPSLRVSGGQRGAGGIQYMFKKMCGVIMYAWQVGSCPKNWIKYSTLKFRWTPKD